MKIHRLLLVSVLVCGSGANAQGPSDKYRTQSGSECSTTYFNPHSIELGIEGDTSVGSDGIKIKPFVKYVYKFGSNSSNRRIECTQTQFLDEERMRLENERLRLELEVLRKELEQDFIEPEEFNRDW